MLQIWDPAPDFKLMNQDNQQVTLKTFEGKWLILYFYPKDNTPGCSLEAVTFTQELASITKLGAEVVGVSPDSVRSHCSFIEKKKLDITLLSDPDRIALSVYGVWQKKKLYGKEYMGVVRTTVLIDPEGKTAYVWNKVKVVGHIEAVITKLKELR